MFERAQQVGTKSPALRVRSLKRLPFQRASEELVRQFTRRVFVTSLAPEERHHRRIVGGAEVAQRLSRLRGGAARGEHLRPTRRGEGVARRAGGMSRFPEVQFQSKTKVRDVSLRLICPLSEKPASTAQRNGLAGP